MENTKDKILKRRSKLSPAQQELLSKRLRGEVDSHSRLEVIPKRSQTSLVPLSFAQQRLWFLHQFDPSNPSYNQLASIQLVGTLNVAALEQSLNEIVQRHEALRTTFGIVEGQPAQVIHPTVSTVLPVVNLRELPETVRQTEVEWLTTQVAEKPFDMASGPLLRVTLLQTGELEYLLLFVIHHIVVDGWSIGVLFQELAILYEVFSNRKTSPLPELPIQYADYAIWQRQWMQRELQKTQLSYWKQQLAAAPDVLALPTDRPRPAVQSFRGAIASFKLSPRLTDMLRSLSNREGVTLFMTLLAAFQTLLYRYTGEEDICIGSPIANRNQTETHGLIGCLVNTLVLRTHLSGNPSFLELLGRVREVCVGAYAHADIPFEQLVEELQPERNLSHMPLFQVAFAWQEDFQKDLKLSSLTLSWLSTHSQTAKFDLTLHIVDAKPELKVLLEYNTDLFNAETITRMAEHFSTLLEGIIADPQARLTNLPLLTPAQLHQQVVEWNDTSTNYLTDKCVHQLFEAQVELSPDAIAVVYEDEQLTYRELNARSNQLAHYLQKLGVRPEILVGICVERSLDMAIGLLGILKAGGAYVPLEPRLPQERLTFILEDAQVSVLLTQKKLVLRLPNNVVHVVYLNTDWGVISQENEKNPVSSVTPLSLAYVIYTSGSTGKPKGTMIPHLGLVNYLIWCKKFYTVGDGCGAPVNSSIGFDATITSLFSPLLVGKRVVLLSEENEIETLSTILRSTSDFSLVKITPAHLEILNQLLPREEIAGQTRALIIGGEALLGKNLAVWQTQAPDTRIINEYGPTETVVGCCVYEVSTQTSLSGAVPIGCPIANTQLYILDKYLQSIPIGVPGELYIGGDGLARGYLNRPELTAEKFIPNPFRTKTGARLYKTGDLARYLPNGDIEYLGRIDHQVKVHGFRIELGEIEALISQYPAVRETVVVVRSDSSDSQRLVAYIVTHSEQTLTIAELRHFLEFKLPNYMLPTAFVMLKALPLTPNGKVDRRALPALETLRPELEVTYVKPRTEVERTIAAVWQKSLNVKNVGIHDNFFDLGGHSLLMVQVYSQLRQIFQANFSMLELFRYPTISSLTEFFNQANKNDPSSFQRTDARTEQVKDGKDRIKKFLTISKRVK